MNKTPKCDICGKVYEGGREMTCSDDCHDEMVRRLVAKFGEFKKVVRMRTGIAYKVPTRDILEHGITEQDLDRYPLWDGPLKMTPPNGRRTCQGC